MESFGLPILTIKDSTLELNIPHLSSSVTPIATLTGLLPDYRSRLYILNIIHGCSICRELSD